MKRTVLSMTAAAMMAASVTSAIAMQEEVNALTGAVYNGLTQMQMDVADITNLTLGEINRIDSIMHGGGSESEKKRQISNILRQASDR